MIAMQKNKIILNKEYKTLGYIKTLLKDFETMYSAIHTTWWTLNPCDLYDIDGLPCDPRRSPLLQSESSMVFNAILEDPNAFGEFGLSAFAAAYHGNIIISSNKYPTSLDTWDEVNELIKIGFLE